MILSLLYCAILVSEPESAKLSFLRYTNAFACMHREDNWARQLMAWPGRLFPDDVLSAYSIQSTEHENPTSDGVGAVGIRHGGCNGVLSLFLLFFRLSIFKGDPMKLVIGLFGSFKWS